MLRKKPKRLSNRYVHTMMLLSGIAGWLAAILTEAILLRFVL